MRSSDAVLVATLGVIGVAVASWVEGINGNYISCKGGPSFVIQYRRRGLDESNICARCAFINPFHFISFVDNVYSDHA